MIDICKKLKSRSWSHGSTSTGHGMHAKNLFACQSRNEKKKEEQKKRKTIAKRSALTRKRKKLQKKVINLFASHLNTIIFLTHDLNICFEGF